MTNASGPEGLSKNVVPAPADSAPQANERKEESSPPGQPATADRAGACSGLRPSTRTSAYLSAVLSRTVRRCGRAAEGVGSVNHTALPDSPSRRPPQPSL